MPAQGGSSRQRLSKQEIVEILKRNFELYRNEPNFIEYLIQLAFYLIQFQYDPSLPDAPRDIEPGPNAIPPAPTEPGSAEMEIVTSLQATFSIEHNRAVCPFCGKRVRRGDSCPSCGLTPLA
ncbi:MAG: hypothetical protein NTW86_16880 [Candidatus Sumerlaeota bacterium]|nr:hypothetical protein [Candidatus Sumerlaeota bacterium]